MSSITDPSPDLTGQTLGFLTVIRRLAKQGGQPRRAWLCHCVCGKELVRQTSALLGRPTISCGCMKSFSMSQQAKRPRKKRPNYRNLPEYNIWWNMRRRCLDPKDPRFADYGGRGITICDRWSTIRAFFEDMGPRPSPRHTLDRKDNDGPYSPENCRWATPQEQARNKRNNHPLTYQGRTQTMTAWAEELGMSVQTLACRLNRQGWTAEEALSFPVNRGMKRH